MTPKKVPTLRDLYPHLDDEQLVEVENTLERYLAFVMRIFERLESQTDDSAHLTAKEDELPFGS